MEILRFEQVPEGAPQRKKSSRGFLALGLVAALFGISTAFATASTQININNGQPVEVGQAITAFVTCDKYIGINPETKLDSTLVNFVMSKITIGYPYSAPPQDYKIDDTVPANPTAPGCADKDFLIKFYNTGSTTPLTCTDIFGNSAAETAGLNSYFDVTNTDGSGKTKQYKCADGAIAFHVYSGTGGTYDINFKTEGPPSGFFDHLSIETTSGLSY